jgi:hypothetical protein
MKSVPKLSYMFTPEKGNSFRRVTVETSAAGRWMNAEQMVGMDAWPAGRCLLISCTTGSQGQRAQDGQGMAVAGSFVMANFLQLRAGSSSGGYVAARQ